MLILAVGYKLVVIILGHRTHKAFVSAISKAQFGEVASLDMLPPALRNQHTAEEVLGKGTFGCVVKAKKKVQIRTKPSRSCYLKKEFLTRGKAGSEA